MKHPAIDQLALYAGGDMPLFSRHLLRWHLRGCAECAREVEWFRNASREATREALTMPDGVSWDRLAAEMRANIHLGLEAAEAISAYPSPMVEPRSPAFSWRLTALAAVMVAVLAGGYWFNALKRSERMAALRGPEPVVVKVSEGAVGLVRGGRGIELQAPQQGIRSGIVMSVSTDGAAAASYVDEETGQVTVNHVYVD
jgi:hypothetical protein